jgi:hypothetical protein
VAVSGVSVRGGGAEAHGGGGGARGRQWLCVKERPAACKRRATATGAAWASGGAETGNEQAKK